MPAVADMDRKVGETAGAHRHTVLWRQVVTDRALICVLQVRDLTDNEIVRLRNRVHSGSERKGIGPSVGDHGFVTLADLRSRMALLCRRNSPRSASITTDDLYVCD